MKRSTRFSVAMLIWAGALSIAMSAPAVFAEEGHGGRSGGHGHDDVVTAVTPVSEVDNDVHDDHGVDAVVPTSSTRPVDEEGNETLDHDD